MTLETFMNMGGYAQYVWPAFSVALIVLVANVIVPLKRLKKLKRRPQ